MINSRYLKPTRVMMESLEYRNIAIDCKPGTPLDILTSSSRVMFMPDANGDNAVDVKERALLKASSPDMPNGESAHDRALQETTKLVSSRISKSLNYARSVVNPLVLDILEKCQEIHNDEGFPGDVEVKPITVPVAFQDAGFMSLLDGLGFDVTTSKPLSKKLIDDILLTLTPEVIKRVMSTGSTSINESLKDTIGVLTLKTITEAFYETSISNGFANDFLNVDKVICLVFTMGVYNGMLEDFSLDAINKLHLSEAINYYGNRVKNQAKRCLQAAEEQRLVLGREYNTVFVLDPLYTEWVNDKGSIQALRGALLKTKLPNGSSLLNNPEVYATKYDSAVNTYQISARVSGSKNIVKCIRREITDYIREEYEDDVDVRTKFMNEASEHLDNLVYTGAEDLDICVLRVVCKIIAEHTNAYDILTDMRIYMREHDDADVNTAALVATANLIGKWIGSQVYVQDVK